MSRTSGGNSVIGDQLWRYERLIPSRFAAATRFPFYSATQW